MGANFVRLAHYPQDPEVYRTADSLGLLVWDELPWDRGGLGGPEWQANTRRLLRQQIRQNINHPSIILWSLGNEVYDLVEAPNSGNAGELRAFLTELKAIANELDPSRPTSMRKFDAGADRAITQFFFSPECFLRFRDQAAAMGIDAEIVPGILPVSNVAQTRKFAAMCRASIPAWMERLFEGLDDRPAARQLVAATVAAELCAQLYSGGVRHFHFYTLNRAELSYAICHLLGLRPKKDQDEYRRTA